MNREIKFRFWTGTQMEDWGHVQHWESLGFYLGGGDGYIPMQFTEKKDKNKKEIYEGDVVLIDIDKSSGNGRSVLVWIEYVENMAQFRGYVIHTSECEDIDISELDDYELEVIGNVHENPELLK